MTKMTDEQLVAHYLAGSERALEALVKRYIPRIYGYARNYTGNPDIASDITQETFVKAWKNLKRFDQRRNFKTWLFTIAKRTAVDWLRKREALPFSALEDAGKNIVDNATPFIDRFAAQEVSRGLVLATAKLPNLYGTVICQHINDDLSFREIAEATGEPLNTIKSRYRRGLVLLKKLLKEE